MGQLTPSFLFDLESNMRLITMNEYSRLNSRTWWKVVGKTVSSMSRRERITWLLETAQIERTIRNGGQVIFEDIVSQTMEYESSNAGMGLELKKEEFEDLDGNGVRLATHWSKQIGAYAAYWPQKEMARAILANPVGYDGQPFFSTAHPYNPFNTGAGVYANLLTGSANGAYPGAVPIHGADLGVALTNLQRAVSYITGAIKMPNGVDPRNLRVAGILTPPALTPRAVQLTNAKFLGQAVGSGVATGDIEAVVRYLGLGQPVECPELGAAFGGSDTSYYVAVEGITNDELGAFSYVEREAFNVIYHGPMTDAQLARARKLQWLTEGRNIVAPGHPFYLFRCDAT